MDHFIAKESAAQHGLGPFLRWVFTRHAAPWPNWIDFPQQPKPEPRSTELRVTFINHSTVLLQCGDWNILTDPVWSYRVSPLSWIGPRRHHAPGVAFEDLPAIDLVLLSHDHYDHCDIPTLRRLAERHQPVFCVPRGLAELFRREGLPQPRELDWWEELEVPERAAFELAAQGAEVPGCNRCLVRVTATPAQHFSGRKPWRRNRTRWCGYALHFNPPFEHAIYFAGDTGYGQFGHEIGHRLGPFDLAIIPIGAYLPRWFMAPVHLSPPEALALQSDVQAAAALGVHFGTFRLADDGPEDALVDLRTAKAALGSAAPDFFTLRPGESRQIEADLQPQIRQGTR